MMSLAKTIRPWRSEDFQGFSQEQESLSIFLDSWFNPGLSAPLGTNARQDAKRPRISFGEDGAMAMKGQSAMSDEFCRMTQNRRRVRVPAILGAFQNHRASPPFPASPRLSFKQTSSQLRRGLTVF
jgi:hypothetical protein